MTGVSLDKIIDGQDLVPLLRVNGPISFGRSTGDVFPVRRAARQRICLGGIVVTGDLRVQPVLLHRLAVHRIALTVAHEVGKEWRIDRAAYGIKDRLAGVLDAPGKNGCSCRH